MMIFRWLLLILPILLVSPQDKYLPLFVYFISYPALIYLAFRFQKKRRAFFLYGFGVVYFLFQMRWMGQAKYHGDMIIAAYVLLSFVFSYPYFVLGRLLPDKIEQLDLKRILGLGLIFSLLEYSRLFILSGFPFHTVGSILVSNLYSLQMASIVGLYGLSFIVIVSALYGVKHFESKNHSYLMLSLFPFVVGAGLFYIRDWGKVSVKNLDVAVIQQGLKVEQKWDIGYEGAYIEEKDQLANMWSLMKEAKGAELMLLPESSFPSDAADKKFSRQELQSIFDEDMHHLLHTSKMSYLDVFAALSIYLDADIFVGLLESDFNSAFYFSRGELLGRYDKQRLVPIGEYIPFEFLRDVARRYGAESFFSVGKKKNVIHGVVNILPTICYDEGFAQEFLGKQGQKPALHVNLSNDGWFLDSLLLDHHYQQGIVRSVESGLFTIRACNTGISAIISPQGEVLAKADERDAYGNMNRQVLRKKIELYRKKPLFALMGNLALALICALWVGILTYLSSKVEVLKT